MKNIPKRFAGIISCFVVFVSVTVGVTCRAQDQPMKKGAAETAVKDPRFYIGEYRVKGNTLLSQVEVELALTPYLGENETIKSVESARKALEQIYHDKGYPTVLVNIPEQDVVDGVVYLQVVEGRIDELRVTGSRYFSLDRIREEIPSLSEGNVPYLPVAQQQIANANKASSDRNITPVLRPGKFPGTVEVELRVKDKLPVHGNIEVDNRHAKNTHRWRAGAQIGYDNLWQREHSLSLQYQTSPNKTDEVQVIAGTYLWRFTHSDSIVVLYGIKSASDTNVVNEYSVIGKGNILGTRYLLPLSPGRDYFHSFSVGFDYKDLTENLTYDSQVCCTAAQRATLEKPISYTNWAVQYSGTWRGEKSLVSFTISPNFGIRGVTNDTEEFERKRYKGKPNYFYLRTDIKYESQGGLKNSTLRLRLAGQIADSALISSEQFSAGGADTVRGYFESQALGDNAVLANIEWYSPVLFPNSYYPKDELRLLLFIDGSYLQRLDALPAEAREYKLYGAGIGVRMNVRNFDFRADFANPFKNNVNIDENQVRAHLGLQYNF